jgi:acyl-homoserine-lactone acylase
VLARWDLRENLDSRGAILFRGFWSHAPASLSLWSQPFDVANPVNTPRGLNTSLPGVKTALGDAIAELRGAGIALDARVGDVQGVTRHGSRIPLHGGPGDPNGEFNAIYAPFIAGRGFGDVEDGSSFVQVVTWGAGRCPDAATILTYSQSENPSSRFNSDQTRLFSRKRWLTDRFCRSDVRRHTVDTTVLHGDRIRVKAG